VAAAQGGAAGRCCRKGLVPGRMNAGWVLLFLVGGELFGGRGVARLG